MAIDVTDVVSQYGAYYKPGSDNQKNLKNMLYYGIETASFFQQRLTEDTIYRGTLASLDRVVQPFQKKFTPISTLSFVPNEFPLYKLKINLEETPDDLEATYLGFLASIEEQDRTKWPFVRWWLEMHVFPKKNEDLELNEHYSGVYAAPNGTDAGAISTAMNGLRKTIRAYNTAGRTNLGNGAINTGALAADPVDFVDQVEAFADAIPTLFRSKLDALFMSKENATKYLRGKRKKYNQYYAQAGDMMNVEDYNNIKIVGLQSMSAAESNMLWSSIPENRIRPLKKASLADTIRLQPDIITVKAHTEWWEALNFEVPEFIFHNDQDLA